MAIVKAAGLKKPPLAHPYLVSVPYASGDPHFIRRWNPDDGATWRWDPKSFDKTVTPQAYAWTATKYTEWAKNFENHFSSVDRSDLNHFRGLLLNNLPEGQAARIARTAGQAGEARAARAAARAGWNYLNAHYWSARDGLFLSRPSGGRQSYSPGMIADLVGALGGEGRFQGPPALGLPSGSS